MTDQNHYGMKMIGVWWADPDGFHIDLDDVPGADEEYSIYAFLDREGAFVRIGSSKGKLRNRMKACVRDLTNATHGRKSPSADWEPAKWQEIGGGKIIARRGSLVSTPVGD
ncbi:MAG: hypothetical protein AAGF15_10865, partial [Pseudomonadota bacterium]